MATAAALTAIVFLAPGILMGCAARAPLAQAIAARGGPLPSLARRSEALVTQGFPGIWRWRTVYRVPDRFAWTIETTREPDHYLFDGQVVRAFVGSHPVATDASPQAPLRSQARFMAVIGLDGLRELPATVRPLPPHDRPPGTASAFEVRFDDGGRYRLGFDGRGLLRVASGPLALAPFGGGEVTVEFDDFRRTGRWVLPYRARWLVDSRLLAEERVLAACPDPPELAEADFRTPMGLPRCGE